MIANRLLRETVANHHVDRQDCLQRPRPPLERQTEGKGCMPLEGCWFQPVFWREYGRSLAVHGRVITRVTLLLWLHVPYTDIGRGAACCR